MLGSAPDAQPGAEAADEPGFPIRSYLRGEPVPELGRIEPRRWRAILAPLSRRTRTAAIHTVRGPEQHRKLMVLLGELMLEDGARQEELFELANEVGPPPAPRPHAVPRE